MNRTQVGSVRGEIEIANIIPDLDTFVRDTFGRSPALFPGAMTSRTDLLPRLADLDRLLRTRRLPDLRVERDTLVPKSAYTLAAAGPERVDVAKLWDLYTAGNTVFIGHLEKVWPPALAIAGPLCAALACQTNVLAVATAAHQAGVPAHHDELDVVVVQAQGTKNWRVWPTRSEGRDRFRVIDADREGAPVIEVTLRPGDVLYLPHGTPHCAMTTDQPSIHLSIALTLPNWDELMASALGAATAGIVSNNVVALTDDNLHVVADSLCQRLTLLRKAIESLDLEAEIRDHRGRLLANVDAARFTGEQLLTFPRTQVQIVDSTGGNSVVVVGRQTATVPNSILAALNRARAAARPVTCQQLFPGMPGDSAQTLTVQLLRLGVLTIASAKSSSNTTILGNLSAETGQPAGH